MGKKGEALRAAKMEAVKYTFTKAQLQEHDRFIIQQKMDEIKAKYKDEVDKYANEYIEREWKAREEILGDKDSEDRFFNLLTFLLCTSSRVLIEKFHWKPIPNDKPVDHRNRTLRFADALIDEINMICDDKEKDIRAYSEETYKKYGIKFDRKEVE